MHKKKTSALLHLQTDKLIYFALWCAMGTMLPTCFTMVTQHVPKKIKKATLS